MVVIYLIALSGFMAVLVPSACLEANRAHPRNAKKGSRFKQDKWSFEVRTKSTIRRKNNNAASANTHNDRRKREKEYANAKRVTYLDMFMGRRRVPPHEGALRPARAALSAVVGPSVHIVSVTTTETRWLAVSFSGQSSRNDPPPDTTPSATLTRRAKSHG